MAHANWIILILTILLNSTFDLSINEGDDWKKSLEKDGIVIYTRKLKSSPFKEFLAEAEMNGTIANFKNIISDIDQYNQWMPDCRSAVIIDHPNANDITYHMKLNVPFPFSDRDIVQQIILKDSKDKLEVDIINRPEKLKEEKNYVRMVHADGKWIVEQISKYNVSIKFQYAVDPGGGVPPWLVNTFVVKNPHLTMLQIKTMLNEE